MLGLDLRSFHDIEADALKQLFDALQGPGHRVNAAGRLPPTRQSDVDMLPRQLGGERGILQFITTPFQDFLHTLFGGIDQLADSGTLLGRESAQLLQLLGKLTLLSQKPHPHLIERRQGIGRDTFLFGEFDQFSESFLHGPSNKNLLAYSPSPFPGRGLGVRVFFSPIYLTKIPHPSPSGIHAL